jgi:predicted kinase
VRECDWQRGTGQAMRAAAAQVIAETGLPLAVVGVTPAGEVVQVRAFQRAQQAKSYRTKIGSAIDPDPTPARDPAERWSRAKAFAFVVCSEGHFV